MGLTFGCLLVKLHSGGELGVDLSMGEANRTL